MYGPEMRGDLLEQLQALPEEWTWYTFPNCLAVCENRASNGALLTSVSAFAKNPQHPEELQVFTFTDEDLEPFRQVAKDCGYPSVHHALSHFLETKAYRRQDQCPALP